RIVTAGPTGHLDVAAQNVGDDPVAGEGDHPVEAGEEIGELKGVQAAGQDGVAGQQEAGPTVVDRDGSRMVARAAGDLQHAPAQVEGHDLRGPAGEAEELLHRVRLPADHGRSGPALELRVAGNVIVVTVGVGDHEL